MNPRSLLWMRNRATWDKRYNPAFLVDIARGGLADMIGGLPITFARASSAWAFNSAGVLVSYASNVPRIVTSPAGLPSHLHETASTNLLTESEFRNGVTDAPTRSGLVSGVAFSGLTAGTGLAFGHDGATVSYAYKAATLVNGTQYTLSVLVVMDDGNAPVFGSATTTDPSNDFVLVLGPSGTLNPLNYVVRYVGGNLYRVSLTLTWLTAWGSEFGVVKYPGNSNRTFKVAGYMLEAQPVATSYIPTTTAQVTRADDEFAPIAMSNIAEIPLTLFVDYVPVGAEASDAVLVQADDGAANNRVGVYRKAVTNEVRAYMVTGGVTQADVAGAAYTSGRVRAAMRGELNNGRAAINGTLTILDSACTMPPGVNSLKLGRLNATFGNRPRVAYYHGWRLYRSGLLDAQLQALTS